MQAAVIRFANIQNEDNDISPPYQGVVTLNSLMFVRCSVLLASKCASYCNNVLWMVLNLRIMLF